MIVGRSRVLLRATGVHAAAARLAVTGRSCAIGAATPLSALAAARRAGGPAFVVRDYARCTASAHDASGLYVNQIGPDRASGRNGWVYKVDGRAGTTGAADPSGAFGDGRRLRGGQQLLWFWCTAGPGQHCQRSLSVTAPAAPVPAGGSVRVNVVGVDDNGRAVAVSGATVTLAGSHATTGAGGAVTVTAPATAGRYPITASDAGLVPSFPASVRVS
jgi:hypothetical protein